MPLTFTYTPPKIDAVAALHTAGEIGTEAAGKLLLSASQPLVPEKSGTLKLSGESRPAGRMLVVVSYSALSKDGYAYGIRQHEDASLHHPNGGEDHFLSKPMETERVEMFAAIAEPLKAIFS